MARHGRRFRGATARRTERLLYRRGTVAGAGRRPVNETKAMRQRLTAAPGGGVEDSGHLGVAREHRET